MKITHKTKSNCLIISKTHGIFSFQSFKTIQFIITQNKKLYQMVWFKKIPKSAQFILIKPSDIILEFLIINKVDNILKLIKSITYKVSFKFKVLYLNK